MNKRTEPMPKIEVTDDMVRLAVKTLTAHTSWHTYQHIDGAMRATLIAVFAAVDEGREP